MDGFTHHTDEVLALAVQSRLSEIWKMISKKEKQENNLLEEFYAEIIAELEEESGYEADEIET